MDILFQTGGRSMDLLRLVCSMDILCQTGGCSMDLPRLVCSMEILLPPVYIGLLITDQYNLYWLVQFNVQCKTMN